jgi:trehalose 6-phosphate synthase/phosphatase
MRLVVDSNRLPFTVSSRGRVVDFSPSVGGLATGLSSYLERSITAPTGIDEYIWVGWLGNAVPKRDRSGIVARARADYRAPPVFIGTAEMERFYHSYVANAAPRHRRTSARIAARTSGAP